MKDEFSFIIKLVLSDHYMIGITFDVSNKNNKKTNKTQINEHKESRTFYNNKVLNKLVENFNWETLAKYNNVEDKYEKLIETMKEFYSKSVVTKKTSNVVSFKFSKELKLLINDRNAKYKSWKNSINNFKMTEKNIADKKNEYHKVKNKVKKKKKQEKFLYDYNYFKNCNNDTRLIWKRINCITGRKVKGNIDGDIIKKFGVKKDNELDNLANKFAETFVNEIKKVSITCQEKFFNIESYEKINCNELNNWKNINDDEIVSVLKELNPKKSPGIDNIRMSEICNSKPLRKIIQEIINQSLSTGIVPCTMKIAISRPLYKGGKGNDFGNYRPLQILPAIEKILEKVIFNQLSSHLEENSIINKHQFAYQKNRSAELLLQELTDFIYEKLSMNQTVIIVFIDFTKAFDVLVKDVILKKLQWIGINNIALEWFRNYLSDRNITVKLKNALSSKLKWETGVPQGSLLGPILFLIAVNSLPHFIRNFVRTWLFADDTTLVAANKDPEIAINRLQKEYIQLQKWTHDHGLVINEKKTKYLQIIKSGSINKNLKLIHHDHECLHGENFLNCKCKHLIELVEYHKYLGVTFDYRMDWDHHFNFLNNKLRSQVANFSILKNLLSTKTLLTIYFALVQSVLNYGVQCFAIGNPTGLERIAKLQIKIIEIIAERDKRGSTEIKKFCKENNILLIHDHYIFRQIVQFYEEKKFLSQKTHSFNTRKKFYQTPVTFNKFGDKTLNHEVPRLFNTYMLGFEIEEMSKTSLKKKIKNHLLNSYCK